MSENMPDSFLILVLLLVVGGLLGLMTISLVLVHGSKKKAAKQVLSLLPLGFSWILSTLSRIIRYFGAIFRFTSVYEILFSLYPGTEFAQNRREDFIDRGIKYIEQGLVDVEQEPEELAREVRQIYRESGTRLSDGEAFFGFSLAIVGYFSIGSAWLTTVLSLGLALAVATRITALDSVMYVDPDTTEGSARLRVMLAWNHAMSNGAKILSTLAILRFFLAFDRRVYEAYLDWVFSSSMAGENLRKRDVVTDFRRPMLAIIRAKLDNVEPEEMSKKLYGEDVFRFSDPVDPDLEEDIE
jgi:hypothetical protein